MTKVKKRADDWPRVEKIEENKKRWNTLSPKVGKLRNLAKCKGWAKVKNQALNGRQCF